MRTRTKILIATLAIGLPAFMLSPHSPPGQAFWPDVHGPAPAASLMPFFMLYGAVSALGLGFGAGYLLFGWAWTRQAFASWSLPAHLAIAFMSGSFWLHDGFHATIGEDMGALLGLEWGFHVPMIAGSVILATAAAKSATARTGAATPRVTRA